MTPSEPRVGDWLLVYGDASPPEGRGEAGSWRVEARHGDAALWLRSPDVNWYGAPWRGELVGSERVWLFGELYSSELHSSVPATQNKLSSTPEQLNGNFLLIVLGDDGRFRVSTNRFGTLHAYRCDGRARVVGSSFLAVAKAASSQQLDWPALAGFFAHGFFPGEATAWQDVKILRPASTYVFADDGRLATAQRYWHWQHRPGERSLAQAADEFGGVFDEVMADLYASERIAVPLSGGLDSRSTVAALPRVSHAQGVDSRERIWSYSYGYQAQSPELAIARRIAEVRGLGFEERVVEPYLLGQLSLVHGCVEGFQDVTQSRQATILELLRERSERVIAAHWGDVWLDDMGLAARGPDELSEQQMVDHALSRIRKNGRRWLLDEVCAQQLPEAVEPLLRSGVAEELRQFGDVEDPDFRIKAFKTDQWSFRWTVASLRMYQAAVLPRLPFYDTRISDFFATVPSNLLVGRRLQVEYLKQRAPDLARIPWQQWDADLYFYSYFGSLMLPKRIVKKAWRILRRARTAERNWEVQLRSDQQRRALERLLLEPGLRLHDFASPAKIRQLLGTFYSHPDAASGYTVSMLLTFSTFLEHS